MNNDSEKNKYLETKFIKKIKTFCKEYKIDFVDEYRLAKNKKRITYHHHRSIPSLSVLQKYFEKTSAVKKYLNEEVGLIKRNDFEDPLYIYKIKERCKKNNIKTIIDYRRNTTRFKEERIPTFSKLKRILGNKCEEFLINKIELASSSPKKKFLNEDFIKKTKKYLEQNNIVYASNYDKKRDKSWMPTRERLRQVHGASYLYEKLGLKAKKGKNKNYVSQTHLKNILEAEEIYSINEYKLYKEKYDLSNETPLPPAHTLKGGVAKFLGLSKNKLKEKKIKKTYSSYRNKFLNPSTNLKSPTEKIEHITNDTSLDSSKKMHLLLMFFDENEINYDLEYLATLVKDNYPNRNTFRTNYYTIRADLINLGIIKGKIKPMHHITNEEEKEIIELYKKGHNPTQIAEWIKTSSLKKENRPGVVRVLKEHKLIK